MGQRSIPIVAIITPGTITTGNSLSSKIIPIQVQLLDFSNATQFGHPSPRLDTWVPSNRLLQMTKAVAYGGWLLPGLPPESTNVSFSIDMFAPHITCQEASNEELADVTQSINEWVSHGHNASGPIEYLAWTQGPGASSGLYNISFGELPTTFDYANHQDPSQLFVYARLTENFMKYENREGKYTTTSTSVLTSCSFQNASYSLGFDYINGVQNMSVWAVNPTADIVISKLNDWNEPASQERWSYTSLIVAYLDILVGWASAKEQGGSESINGTTVLSTNLGKYLFSQGDFEPAGGDYEVLPDVFLGGLEELFFNMTFSLLSHDAYV